MRIFSSWGKYIIIALVLALVTGGGIYAWKIKSQQKTLSSGESMSPTPTPNIELATWKDEAGFTIQYPKGLSVNKHEEDNENYAHLELTNKDHPGRIIVWVKDLPKGVTDVGSWIKGEKTFAGGTIIDSTLGSEPAKKIVVGDTLTVGTISEDLLFSVEATLTDKEYWSGVFDTISGSFAFVSEKSAANPQQGGSAGAGADVDEEEIVE